MGKNKGRSVPGPSDSSTNARKSWGSATTQTNNHTPKIAVAVAILASLLYYLFSLSSAIDRIDLTDSLALREYFFGEGPGKSYVILCHPKDATLPMSKSFTDASKIVDKKVAQFLTVDCNEALPSGVSVGERLGIDLTKKPAVFVSGGKVSKPIVVPVNSLKTGYSLAKVVRSILTVKAAKIEVSIVL